MSKSAIARSSILIVALGWLTITRADTSPPVVTGFDFTPKSVDVTAGSATVTCTMQVTDSPAGATEVNARFISPISFQIAYCYGSLISGTPQNGTWQGVAKIPLFAESGGWRAEVHQLVDAVDNSGSYYTADLQHAGYPTNLAVTSAPDTTAPALTGFSFAPQSVDAATSSATVVCTMHATDAPAGATEVNARFISPISFQVAYCYGSLVSGTPQSGTWQGTATIPAFAEGGTWRAEVHQLYDAIGNSRAYSTSDLQQAGFPTDLSVISTSDTSSPTLTSFDFNPKNVDISTESATTTCTMAVTDAPAGATEVNARFISPVFHQVAYCYGSLSSGTPQSGTWQGVAAIPQYSEEGIWKAQAFQIVDAVGNTAHYDTAALQQAGFPTDLTVGFADGGPVADIYHPRDAATVRGNSVTVAARLTQGSPASVSPSLGVLFEYRELPSAMFAPIPTSDANHPNPDTTFPYFVHWDVSSLPVGGYALRAIAHALNGAPDPVPSVISINVCAMAPASTSL